MRRRIIALLIVASACRAPSSPPATPTPAPLVAAPAPPVVVVARADVDAAADADASDAAVARLEAFVAAHPVDTTHVPDALLRLGGLYLDRADLARAAGDDAGLATATAAAVAALARLTDGHAAYPRRDAALYLLGYARAQAGDDDGAVAAYAAITAMASSRYVAEAWLRIGELQFARGALPEAATAYAVVVARADPRFAPIARYKLAWTHFRADAYPDAIAGFQAVLDQGSSDLRDEAITYLALCLTEPDWDRDGADDPTPPGGAASASVARIAAHLGDGADATRRAVAERAAGDLVDMARYREAIAAYQRLLALALDALARARLEAARDRAVDLAR